MWNWLFNRKKKQVNHDFEINYLKIILLNLEHSKKTNCQDMIVKVEKIKFVLESSEIRDMTEMMNLFSQTSTLKDIAEANDWEDQYLHIDKYLTMKSSGLLG